jgi:enterochelin esterase-like enzyme
MNVLRLTLCLALSARAGAAVAQSPRGPIAATTRAGQTATHAFWSQSLGTRKNYVVYLPPSYASDGARRFPVAYYLHGLWGAETDWVQRGRLDVVMDSLVAAGGPEMIVVMPDGDDGWYTTWNFLGDYAGCRRAHARASTDTAHVEDASTYCVPWPKYDDYIARDLVAHVDSAYRTIARREARGIAGLSMGGYGAITLALRYPEVFSAAASHSGVLSPLYAGGHPFTPPPVYASEEGTLRTRWRSFWFSMGPAFGRDTIGWWARDPARIARRAKRTAVSPLPALFADVGTEDDFVDENRAFRAELASSGIALDYAEWPGAHSWPYWQAHVAQSLTWLGTRIGK